MQLDAILFLAAILLLSDSETSSNLNLCVAELRERDCEDLPHHLREDCGCSADEVDSGN